MKIVADLTKSTSPQADALTLALARIAELEAAASAPRSTFTMKVSEKGCLSVYGLNVRGIHLYASQWERILANADKIAAFIKAHPELARKHAD